MSDIRNELKYVASHEWIRDEGDGTVTIGITDHAQDLLGDVVFVELPDVGTDVAAGDDAGVVESVKAASDVYVPLSGEVVEVNEQLEESPELVNSDPYGDGWFFRIKLSDVAELDDLLDADAYGELCEGES
ncbi:glycine cleavage system protein GcvH [Neptunomonas antarctica]|uniref:Glycine cleavage system H protein n=1 Tax=Neptunomonas antarctica TaxID=619304 RepID=A0A1N7MJK1_9GAMM|nr:glycine cleavage system protein GcvH [Neptunomonas antarctica]SIS86267.1 glycine cleavage system H protein [Neptunomonas antarctica]